MPLELGVERRWFGHGPHSNFGTGRAAAHPGVGMSAGKLAPAAREQQPMGPLRGARTASYHVVVTRVVRLTQSSVSLNRPFSEARSAPARSSPGGYPLAGRAPCIAKGPANFLPSRVRLFAMLGRGSVYGIMERLVSRPTTCREGPSGRLACLHHRTPDHLERSWSLARTR